MVETAEVSTSSRVCILVVKQEVSANTVRIINANNVLKVSDGDHARLKVFT
jgi:hypothetical protein